MYVSINRTIFIKPRFQPYQILKIAKRGFKNKATICSYSWTIVLQISMP